MSLGSLELPIRVGPALPQLLPASPLIFPERLHGLEPGSKLLLRLHVASMCSHLEELDLRNYSEFLGQREGQDAVRARMGVTSGALWG